MDISRITGSLATTANNAQEADKKGIDFGKILSQKLDQVNNMQAYADEMTESFISGQAEDLHTVMIATEEARLSLELAVQIRNKMVEAYQELNRMQL